MMRRISVVAACLLMLSISASGCGYTRQTVLPNDIQTVFVAPVQNKTKVREFYAYVPGLELDINQAIIRRLQRDGNLLVAAEDEADAVLNVNLLRFEQEGLRFTSLESVEEYRIFIVVELELKDKRTDQIIFREENFTGDSEYYVSDVRSINREEAARTAVERLARNIVDRIVEDW